MYIPNCNANADATSSLKREKQSERGGTAMYVGTMKDIKKQEVR